MGVFTLPCPLPWVAGVLFGWGFLGGGGFRPLGLEVVYCVGQCLNGALDAKELSVELTVEWGGLGR